MELLNLLRFWKSSPVHEHQQNSINDVSIDGSSSDYDIDEEDSFFELQITSIEKQLPKTGEKIGEIIFAESKLSRFKCTRILPMEQPISKPQSPVSILKSGPKFRIFSSSSKTESKFDFVETPKHPLSNKKYTFKINFEQEKQSPSSPSMFRRVNSARSGDFSKHGKQITTQVNASPINSSSKRFNYLRLIKPLYVKVSKQYNDRVKLSDLVYSVSSSPSPSPVNFSKKGQSGLRVRSMHLGKSRSASAAIGVSSPAISRRDDSLLQHDDGIQSAILHCKRSFTSSREESCKLSSCSSEETHGLACDILEK